MNKKTYTVVFTIISSLINILMTAIIIAILLFGVSAFYFKVLGNTKPGTGLAISWMICFVVGLITGMILFSKVGSWVIDKYDLASKLDPKALGRFLPSGKKNAHYQEQEKPKTNLPKPTLAVEDEQWARDIENGISASEDLDGADEDMGNSDDSDDSD